MEPALRKAWLANALAELMGRRRLTQTAIATAMGKSRQNFGEAIARDQPSMRLIRELYAAYPDLPNPEDDDATALPIKEAAPTHADLEAAIDRLEKSVAGILAQNAMILSRIEEALKNKA